MRGFSDRDLTRIGLMAFVSAALVLAAILNIGKLPIFSGTTYSAEFSDASGLRKGQMVQIAGMRVGRVSSVELEGDHVVAEFSIDHDIELGDDTTASIEVLSVLGEKFLRLVPAGSGAMEPDETIPQERTTASYDIVRVLSDLSSMTEAIDVPGLRDALGSVTETLDAGSKDAREALDGLSQLSNAIASRDEEIDELLDHSSSVFALLAKRRTDVVKLLRNGDHFLAELESRRDTIHLLLVRSRELADQLTGLVHDNEEQLQPTLTQLHEVTQLLRSKERLLQSTISNLGPYVRVLSHIVGTGPWFDGSVANLLGFGSGEFVPGGGV